MPLEMSKGDWFPVFRKIRKNWVWKDSEHLKAWMEILIRVNADGKPFRHRMALLPVEPGQVAMTISSYASSLGWSRRRAAKFLDLCAEDEMLLVEHRHYDPASKSWKNDGPRTSGIILLTVLNHPLRSAFCQNGVLRAQTTHKQRTNTAQTPHMRQLFLPIPAQEVTDESASSTEVEVVQEKAKVPKTLHVQDRDIRDKEGRGAPAPLGTKEPDPEEAEMEKTLAYFSSFGTPSERTIRSAIGDLRRRQGIPHERIRTVAKANQTKPFFEIVGMLEAGKGDVPFKASPPVPTASRDVQGEVEAVLSRKRAAEEKMAEVPTSEMESWLREASGKAERQGVPGPLRDIYVKSELLGRTASRFGLAPP